MSEVTPAADTPKAADPADGNAPIGSVLTEETSVETPTLDPAATPETKAAEPEQKTSEQTSVVPEKYELKLPEGSKEDPALIEKTALFAKEHKLTQEQAQAILNREVQAKADHVKAQHETLKIESQKWLEQIKADPEIGGEKMKESVEYAKRALNTYAPASLKQMLNTTGLGNNPDVLRTFAKIGRAMADDKFVTPGREPAKEKLDPAEALYGPRK